MAHIEKAKNQDEQTIFPVTVADAVLMGNGKTLKGELSELGSATSNFYAISNIKKVTVSFLDNNVIGIKFNGGLAAIDIYGKKTEFSSTDYFEIPNFKSLLYNKETSSLEVDAINNNNNINKILLIHNENGRIGGGILAVSELQKQTTSLQEQSDSLQDKTEKLGYATSNFYVASNIASVKVSFAENNVLQVTFNGGFAIVDIYGKKTEISSTETFEVPNYKSLLYNRETSLIEVAAVNNVNNINKILLLHNENGKIGGGVFSTVKLQEQISSLQTQSDSLQGKISSIIDGTTIEEDGVYGLQESLPSKPNVNQLWFVDIPLEHNGYIKSVNIFNENIEGSIVYVCIGQKINDTQIIVKSVNECRLNTGDNVLQEPIEFLKGEYIGFVDELGGAVSYSGTSSVVGFAFQGKSGTPSVGNIANKRSDGQKLNFNISYNLVYKINAKIKIEELKGKTEEIENKLSPLNGKKCYL